MPIERINPPDVHQPPMYSHAVRVRDMTLIYTAGQVAWDQDRNVVGVGDLRAQAIQAYENLKRVLAASGADFSNVIKLTTYVVNYHVDLRPIIVEVALQYFVAGQFPAHTLLGCNRLPVPNSSSRSKL
jgi:enamine deaminase RidA (YjgF/YER057c/UK114 family)